MGFRHVKKGFMKIKTQRVRNVVTKIPRNIYPIFHRINRNHVLQIQMVIHHVKRVFMKT
tara:strand:- start:586 stop:762 length:177 start_codon:yes stop_codon:yes gene_type:complete